MKTLLTLTCLALMAATSFAQDNSRATADQNQEAQRPQSTLTEADHLLIAVQKICPVTGEALGSMGEPIKVMVGEQVAYLCCAGCKERNLDGSHWNTVLSNLAAAQSSCPIMDKPVDATMESTVVNGQRIFVCCPPCIAKIQADVEGSLNKVNGSYVNFVARERQSESDQQHASAQGICPVTGQPLGSMGEPIKVMVGDEAAFLCCQGCVGKEINAEHWASIQSNLASAQKVCPVMGEAVDATMQSVVVNGRKIFVCCPPCIAKINADPTTYVAKLDAQIAGQTVEHEESVGHDHAGHDPNENSRDK